MKIILVGYMGCGKSYIGHLLSSLIKYTHFDLDNLIEKIYNLTINLIFKKIGENKFRLIEKNILNLFLKNKKYKKYILSVGGGTPCFYNNMEKINKIGITFYLKTHYKILYNRLLKDNQNRPILKNYKNKKLFNFIKNHINERKKYYLKSKYIINTNNMTFIEVAKYIKNRYI
ncbi:MAG: shikimate kinase [Candidatus Shikimatogenerans sp. JK-2022]|nr:shikimate kinase [Candidatus Shikimatogenerans bostrichidophilus]